MMQQRYVGADYCTVESVRGHLSSQFTETPDDGLIADLIREASDMFAASTERVFVPFPDTVTLRPSRWADLLEIPDLLTLDTLDDGDDALTADDYWLEPELSCPRVFIRRLGGRWSPKREVLLTGTFGYHPEPDRMWVDSGLSLGAAVADTTGTTVTLSVSGTITVLGRLDYIKVDDEVMQVTRITPGTDPDKTVLTVERGALLTAAAAHNDEAPIEKYRQYELVRRAVILRAAHLYKNRADPGGERISGPQGSFVTTPNEPKLVTDTERKLHRWGPEAV